jgi:hypothetical protein
MSINEEEQVVEKLKKLKNGEYCDFDMSMEGGARCHKCNGMYLLFQIPLYGGEERYLGTYYKSQLNDLVNEAFSWT